MGADGPSQFRQFPPENVRAQPGSLFPALHRLEEQGFLSSGWQASENNLRAMIEIGGMEPVKERVRGIRMGFLVESRDAHEKLACAWPSARRRHPPPVR